MQNIDRASSEYLWWAFDKVYSLLVQYQDHELLADDVRRILVVQKTFLNSLGVSPSNVTGELYKIFQLMDRLFSTDRDPSGVTYRLIGLDIDTLVLFVI